MKLNGKQVYEILQEFNEVIRWKGDNDHTNACEEVARRLNLRAAAPTAEAPRMCDCPIERCAELENKPHQGFCVADSPVQPICKHMIAGCPECKTGLFAGEAPPAKCPDGLLPDGPVCPRCGGERAASGVDGGSWVHYNPANAKVTTYAYGKKISEHPLYPTVEPPPAPPAACDAYLHGLPWCSKEIGHEGQHWNKATGEAWDSPPPAPGGVPLPSGHLAWCAATGDTAAKCDCGKEASMNEQVAEPFRSILNQFPPKILSREGYELAAAPTVEAAPSGVATHKELESAGVAASKADAKWQVAFSPPVDVLGVADSIAMPANPCERCGKENDIEWSATRKLWQRISGKLDGILCINCFSKKAEAMGIVLYWQPTISEGAEVRPAAPTAEAPPAKEDK